MIISLTSKALSDLHGIHNAVAGDLGNPQAAKRIVSSILQDIAPLASFPRMGMSLAAKTERETDLFYLISGYYLVFYRIGNKQIAVTRILDGRSNYLRLIFDDADDSEESRRLQ